MVALESVRIHTAINDGILNLVDKFFEMQRDDALRALDLFKRAINQVNFLLSTVRQIIICSILLIFKYLIYLLPQKFCIE
jgi:hypothetical protein